MPKGGSKTRGIGYTTSFPFDVLWNIIQAASEGPEPDFRILCALGGASHALRREAQKHIYRELLIYPPPIYSCHGDDSFTPKPYPDEFGLSWENLQSVVKRCPWIPAYVRGVRFRWAYEESLIDDDAVALISSFKKVQRLTIRRHETSFPLNWETLDSDTLNALKTFMKLPSVHSLRLSSIKNIPPTILNLSKRLRSVSLDSGSSFSVTANAKLKRSIKLAQLRTTGGEDSIQPLFVPPGRSNASIVDVTAISRFEISFPDWETADGGIFESLSNLSELYIDTWSPNFMGFDLPVILQRVHLGSHRKLRQLSLRFGLDRWIEDGISLRNTICSPFPEGLPALRRLEMDTIFQSSVLFDWQQRFLNDLADLDEHLFGPHTSFPLLTSLKLTVTIIDDPDDAESRLLSEGTIIKALRRGVAKQGFRLEANVGCESNVRGADAPSSDESDYGSY